MTEECVVRDPSGAPVVTSDNSGKRSDLNLELSNEWWDCGVGHSDCGGFYSNGDVWKCNKCGCERDPL